MAVNGAHSQTQVRVDGVGRAGAKSNILGALGAAAATYGLFCCFFVLFSQVLMEGDPALLVLHVGAACSLLLFWMKVRWGAGRYDSFGAALVLMSAIFRFHAALDAAFYGARINEIPPTVPLPDDIVLLLLKSESLSFFGVLLVAVAWRTAVGQQVGHLSFLHSYRNVGRQLPIMVYASAIIVEILKRLAGADFGALSLISSMTYSFGVVSIFFICAMQQRRSSRIFLALCLALPMTAFAMGSGMKSEMFFPVVPAGLLFWFGFRSFVVRAFVLGIAFVLLAYSQLYVQYVRESTWATAGQTSVGDLISGFQPHIGDAALLDGTNAISARINMTTTRIITVAIAEVRGFEPVDIFGPIPGSLIPRVFWPSKPVLQPGAQHTFRVRDIDAPAYEATTATAAGFFSELYLGGGYLGWLLGAIAYGYLMARLQLFALKRLVGFGHLSLSFVAAYSTLRFEELHVAYAYTSLPFIGAFLFLLVKTAGVFKVKSARYGQGPA
jgi:hypothetical protein